ncbi:hypothetical protein CPC08DRAFT_174404 [Agrocybe pediades]|nr:hypothetical protein CPC08DRAFT_174404 [Agrocybe pediades]
MHCAGWVHRDISSGNILAYEAGGNQRSRWQAKLSDLEYAKKFYPRGEDKDGEIKDSKTGTPYFMPYEILTSQYLSAPVPKIELSPTELEKIMNKGLKEHLARRGNGSTKETKADTVVHNPQHDVESLWWLKLRTLTCRVNHRDSRDWGAVVFENSLIPSQERRNAFNGDIEYILSDKLSADLVEPFALAMGLFRKCLHNAYIKREQADLVLDLNTYAEVYEFADKFFAGIKGNSAWRAVPLLKDCEDEPVNTKKRSRPTSDISDASGPSGSRKRRGRSTISTGRKPSKRSKV